MLDSSSRFPCVAPLPHPEWEEATFTRPMRSPFAAENVRDTIRDHAPRARGPEVDIALEEAALFDEPRKLPTARGHAALRRVSTAPPARRSLTPPPLDEEITSKGKVNPELIRAIADQDSQRMRQAIHAVEALDLAKTTEEPALDVCDEGLETLLFRRD